MQPGNKKLIGTGLLAALSASLCCITPILSILAGTSGLASTFDWLAPFRPLFIAVTIIVLGLAWYKILKPKPQADCNCGPEEKPKFIQTRSFLGLVTAFTIIMLSFPYYSSVFYPNIKKEVTNSQTLNTKKVVFAISGMTCSSCEEHVNYEVAKLAGIMSADVSYQKASASVEFDTSKTNIAEIEKAISATGYKVNIQQ